MSDYKEILARLIAERSPQGVEKQSSAGAPLKVPGTEKISARYDQYRKLAEHGLGASQIARSIGAMGIEKVAMIEVKTGPAVPLKDDFGKGIVPPDAAASMPPQGDNTARSDGLSPRIVDETKQAPLKGDHGVPLDQGKIEPPAQPDSEGKMPTEDDLATGALPMDANVIKKSAAEASAWLRGMTCGIDFELDDADYRRASEMGVKTSSDALQIFEKTASRGNFSAEDLFAEMGIGDPDTTAAFNQIMAKVSAGDGRNQIAEAKDAVTAHVQARGELPDPAVVAEMTGVSPEAASLATFETAQLVAATGGTLSAPGTQVPGAAGGVAGNMDLTAGAPQGMVDQSAMAPPAAPAAAPAPPMAAPAGTEGSAEGGGGAPAPAPAPADPGMVAQASNTTPEGIRKAMAEMLKSSELVAKEDFSSVEKDPRVIDPEKNTGNTMQSDDPPPMEDPDSSESLGNSEQKSVQEMIDTDHEDTESTKSDKAHVADQFGVSGEEKDDKTLEHIVAGANGEVEVKKDGEDFNLSKSSEDAVADELRAQLFA